MAVKEVVIVVLFVICLVEVLGDGYGGGGHSYMVPTGGGKGKWRIKAKGKGMQNMMSVPSYGGGKKHDTKPEVVYYPIPVYTPSHDSGGYGGGEKSYESKRHEISTIPAFGNGGMGYYGLNNNNNINNNNNYGKGNGFNGFNGGRNSYNGRGYGGGGYH